MCNGMKGPNKDLNSAAIFESLKKSASGKAVTLYSTGDVSKASGRRIAAEYQLPLMAHAAMEPGNCTAHFRGSSCELWAPTQVPQDVRDSVAQAIGLDPDQVKVNVTLMGGGFGRRLEHDYGVEAALVSKSGECSRESAVDARRRYAELDLPSRELSPTQRGARWTGLAGSIHTSDYRAFDQRTKKVAHREWGRS